MPNHENQSVTEYDVGNTGVGGAETVSALSRASSRGQTEGIAKTCSDDDRVRQSGYSGGST